MWPGTRSSWTRARARSGSASRARPRAPSPSRTLEPQALLERRDATSGGNRIRLPAVERHEVVPGLIASTEGHLAVVHPPLERRKAGAADPEPEGARERPVATRVGARDLDGIEQHPLEVGVVPEGVGGHGAEQALEPDGDRSREDPIEGFLAV